MECPGCGATVDRGATVCPECGFALADERPDSGPASDPDTEPGPGGGPNPPRQGPPPGDGPPPQDGGPEPGQHGGQPPQGGAPGRSGQPPQPSGQGPPQGGPPPQQERDPGPGPGPASAPAPDGEPVPPQQGPPQGGPPPQQGRGPGQGTPPQHVPPGVPRDQGPGQGPGGGGRVGGRQPGQPGAGPAATAARVIGSMPWTAGLVGGLLVYGVLSVLLWGGLALLTSTGAVETAAALLTTLTSLTPASTALSSLSADVPADVLQGSYDALLGPLYLLVPWLLYAIGRSFGRSRASSVEGGLDATVVGCTVAVGTAPVMLAVTVAFGADAVTTLLVAGLGLPALFGTLGATGAWLFRGYRRGVSWGLGFVAGLVGLLLVFALTFVWGSAPGAGGLLSRAYAATVGFVGITLGSGVAGPLGYVAVGLPLVGLGYYRARNAAVVVAGPLEGLRAGATLLVGFSAFAGVVVTLYTVVFVLTSTGVISVTELFQVSPLTFLPDSVAPGDIPTMQTLYNYLQAVVVTGVLFPAIGGALGGAVGGLRNGQAGQGEGGHRRRPPDGGNGPQERRARPGGHAPERGR